MNKQTSGMDFESLFQALHQLKIKNDQRLEWWNTLRWVFFLLPFCILIITLPIGLEIGGDINLFLVVIIMILWLFFITLSFFFYSLRKSQAKMLFLFAVGKGDENLPGMDWEFLKLGNQTRKGLLLLLVSILTFFVFLTGNILANMFSESIDSELKPFFGAVGGFLILISLGLIIYYLDFFLNMSEVRGDYFPPDVNLHSRLGILEFVESHLRPSTREDFRHTRATLLRVAGEEGKLFFAELLGLLYLHTRQILVENWGQPKFALNYQQFIENVLQLFPREKFMGNLPLFINVTEKRLRIDLAARLKSIERLGTINDEQLKEILVPLLQIEPDGELLQAFQKMLALPPIDRLLGFLFSEVGHDHHSLHCFFSANTVVHLNSKGALQLLIANNTQEERSLKVRVTSPGLSPEALEFGLQIAEGNFLDILPSDEPKDLFFATKNKKDLRTTLGIFFANSQGFWIELQPQNVGKFAVKAIINDGKTGELISSFQTTILVKRDLVEQFRLLLGLGSIVAGPIVSAVQFLASRGNLI
ncbi:MAG: hypothetical protein ACFFB3_24285 [Candidatus Hodarchaeota archaeon]